MPLCMPTRTKVRQGSRVTLSMIGKYTGFVSVAAFLNIFSSYVLLPYWLVFWLANGCDKITLFIHGFFFFFFSISQFIAQNAYCSRDIYLQFMKYLRSVILPIIIKINARRRVSLVMINARSYWTIYLSTYNPRQKSWHACPLFSICQGNLLVRPPPPDSMLFSVMNSSLLASNIVGGEGGSQCQ